MRKVKVGLFGFKIPLSFLYATQGFHSPERSRTFTAFPRLTSLLMWHLSPKIPFYVYALLFTMDSTSRCSPCPSGISQTRSSEVARTNLLSFFDLNKKEGAASKSDLAKGSRSSLSNNLERTVSLGFTRCKSFFGDKKKHQNLVHFGQFNAR